MDILQKQHVMPIVHILNDGTSNAYFEVSRCDSSPAHVDQHDVKSEHSAGSIRIAFCTQCAALSTESTGPSIESVMYYMQDLKIVLPVRLYLPVAGVLCLALLVSPEACTTGR